MWHEERDWRSLHEPPLIIKDRSFSTPKDHSQWKARRLRCTLNSQGTFGYDNFLLRYSCSCPIVCFDSMPCTFDDHDRLEFLEYDKEALLCLNFVNYLSNEPMPNESLSTEQEAYATFNHILFIWFTLWLWLHMFSIRFANPRLPLCLVKLMTLKRACVGRKLEFH
jgi:hypothetical protein